MKSFIELLKKGLSKFFFNFLSNFIQQGLRFLVLYLAAYKLGPAVFGTISVIILYSSYLLNSNLGAINGLKRQIPIKYKLVGKDEVDAASFSVLIFNVISTFVFTSIVCIFLVTSKTLDLLDSLYLLVLSVCSSNYFFAQTYVIANQLWTKLQSLQFIASAFLSVSVVVLWFFGKSLFLISYSISFLIPAIIILSKQMKMSIFRLSFIKENLKIGFPIMIAGFIFFFFQTTDRLIVSKNYDKEIFGVYALATTLISGFGLFTNLASEIILQKGINYFVLTKSKSLLRRYLGKITIGVTISLLPILILAYLFFQFIIENYFPLYGTSLPIIKNLLCAFFLQQLCIGFGNYYYIIGAQLLYNSMLALSAIMCFCILSYPYFFGLPDTTNFISKRFIICSALYSALIILAALFNAKKYKPKIS